MTLPSNSSTDYHPENTVSRSTTVLAQPVDLTGDWEVALSEISVPTDWCNVSSERYFFMLNVFRLEMPDEWYPTIDSILRTMTRMINEHHPTAEDTAVFLVRKNVYDDASYDENKLTIIYDQATNMVRFSMPEDTYINMSTELANVLGFSRRELPRNKRHHIGERPAKLEYASKTAYVYCDLIEPVFVGDTKTQLLRTANIDAGAHGVANHIYTLPIYIPLQKKHFDTVEINIMTDTGEPVPFVSGRSVVTLHFRRIER